MRVTVLVIGLFVIPSLSFPVSAVYLRDIYLSTTSPRFLLWLTLLLPLPPQ